MVDFVAAATGEQKPKYGISVGFPVVIYDMDVHRNEVLGRCGTCRYFFEHPTMRDYVCCTNEKITSMIEQGADSGGGEYLHVNPDFGCVHWEKKP